MGMRSTQSVRPKTGVGGRSTDLEGNCQRIWVTGKYLRKLVTMNADKNPLLASLEIRFDLLEDMNR